MKNIINFTASFIPMLVILLCVNGSLAQTVSFTSSALAGETVYNPTSLQFGPDGRLYVSQQNGLIHAYTISRNGPNNYSVTNTEVIPLIQQIPNHNDDGTLNTAVNTRQVTGLLVTGTAASPVIYVSSSDPRIGGGSSGPANDKNLDTNSGMLSKLTKNGSSWTRTDLVRGLPRSEENHSTNGMQLDAANNVLYLCQGGNTNMGAPSNNFIFLPEYAYSAAVLRIDLNAIGNTTYDLPTLDDETRTNTGSQPGYTDVNDPFGGNSGKNQAKLDPSGPVQIYSPGWRNHYDLVITKGGRMYSFDNGPNINWGGPPSNCLNAVSEPGSAYCDHLHLVTAGYYAGHPNPTRGNRANMFNTSNPQSPVPAGMENPVECSYIVPGNQPNSITGICASTNGLTEYTASNFSSAMKGDLLAASFNGKLYRFKLNSAGTALVPGGQTVLASGFGTTPLDVTAQGNNDIFPGTIWVATYGSHGITVFEPADYSSSAPAQWFADADNDTYGNALNSQWSVTQPAGYVSNDDDCNDADNTVYPGAPEIADGKDNDCDGFADEYLGVATRVRINCGGSQYISMTGDTFSADIYFSGGTAGLNSGISGIANTDDDLMYKSERYGNFSYNIAIPNGNYSVALHFAEVWSGGQTPGARIFHVDIEGTRVLNNYDIYARAGGYSAIVETFGTTVSDGGLNIVFTKVVNNAKVSAIEILPLTNTPPAFTVSGDVIASEDFSGDKYVTVTPAPVPPAESSQVVSYSLSPSSVPFAQVSINASTGKVTITAIADANGSQLFTITANDGQPMNNIASRTFLLTVTAVNDAPAFSLSGSITVNEDFSGTKTVTASPAPVPADEQSQTVIYSLSPPSVGFANVSINASTGRVTITSVADANGSQLFTITANDGQSSNSTYSQTFTLAVQPVNDAPVFSLSGNITASEDFTALRTVSVSMAPIPADETAQPVRFSISPSSISFANVTIDSMTGTVTVTSKPNVSGSQIFTVTANDKQSQNNIHSETFTLLVTPVNDAPSFTLSGNISADEDFAGAKTVTVIPDAVPADETAQTVVYSLSPSAVSFASVSFNSATGQATIYSLPGKFGSQVFTVQANDGQAVNNLFAQNFTLTIHAVNDPPTLNPLSDLFLDEDAPAQTVPLSGISDGDEGIQMLTITAVSNNPVLIPNPLVNYISPASGGTLTLQIAPNQNGIATIAITVADDGQTNTAITRYLLVSVNAVNDPPYCNPVNDPISVAEDAGNQHLVITGISAGPDESQYLSITASSDNTALIPHPAVSYTPPSSTAILSFAPVPNRSGMVTITVTLNDGAASNNTFTRYFIVTVNEVNDAPTLNALHEIVISEDAGVQTVPLTGITAGPNESQPLTISVASDNPDLIPSPSVSYSYPAATGVLSFQPAPDKSGIATLTITVNDGQPQNNTVTRYMLVIVNAVNDPPYCDAISPMTLQEDAGSQQVVITGITAGPYESQNLTITASSGNTVLIPNPVVSYTQGASTATLTFSPAANRSGTATVTVMLHDGGSSNNTFSRNFIVTVNEVNDAPTLSTINDIIIPEDAGMQTIQLTGISPGANENQTLVITAVSDNPGLIAAPAVFYTYPAVTGTLFFQPEPDKSGIAILTVTADDGQSQNNTVTRYVVVSVQPVNDAPVFTVSGDIQQERNFTATEFVAVRQGYVPEDEQSQMVRYSLQPPSVSFANISIDSVTGLVTVTAVYDSFGSQLFTIVADDGQPANNIATATFNLMIGEGNYAPAFSLSGDVIVQEDFEGVRTVTVTPDPVRSSEIDQTVTYSLSPAGVDFANIQFSAPTGEVRITSVANASGSQLFTITANDGQPLNNTAVRTFLLHVKPVNDAPVFMHSGDVFADEDFEGVLTVTVHPSAVPADEQTQHVVYSLHPASVDFADIQFNPGTGAVTIRSISNANGLAVITIVADDGQAENAVATGSFILSVKAVNDPPVFTVSGDVMLDEDFSGPASVFVTKGLVPEDERWQPVSYSISPATSGFVSIIFDSQSGRVDLYPVKDANGTEVFIITANDGQAENAIATRAFLLSVKPVNDEPYFTLSGDVTANENFSGILKVTATPHAPADESAEVIAYSLHPPAVAFAHVQINSATGEVSITAVPHAYGTQQFTVRADDGQPVNNVYSAGFALTVNEVNYPPVFVLSGDVIQDEDFVTIEKVHVLPDMTTRDTTERVIYRLSPASVNFARIEFDSLSGEVAIASLPDVWGEQRFTITADDGQRFDNLFTQSFVLHVRPVNDAPFFDVIAAPAPVLEDAPPQSILLTGIHAGAHEGEPVLLSAFSANPALISGLTVVYSGGSTAALFYSPQPNRWGTAVITVVADDRQAVHNTFSRTFTVTVLPVNDAPSVDPIASIVINEDAPLQTITLTGIFAGKFENQTLRITASSDNPVLIPHPAVSYVQGSYSAVLSFQPSADMPGFAEITVVVDDGEAENNIFSRTFGIEVLPVNDAPAFAAPDDLILEEDFSTAIVHVARGFVPADEMHQRVHYSLHPATCSFADVAIEPLTGTVIINPVADMSGSAVFTITADDGQHHNNTFTDTFRLTVLPVNDAPAFSLSSGHVQLLEDFQSASSVYVIPDAVAADETAQTITYTLTPPSVDFARIAFNAQTGSVTVTAIPDSNGSALFTVTADDGQAVNNLASATFLLTVEPVNDAPVFELSENHLHLSEDFSTVPLIRVIAAAAPADERGQFVTYSLNPPSVDFAQIMFNRATGAVMISAVPDGNGSRLFTVTADDGQTSNQFAVKTFTLTVEAVNDAPFFSVSDNHIHLQEDFSAAARVEIIPGAVPADESGQTVRYSLNPLSVDFADIQFDSLTGRLVIAAAANGNGSQVFTITADDGQTENNTATQAVMVMIEPVNDAPVFTLSGDVIADINFPDIMEVTVTPAPVPQDEINQKVRYSLSPAACGIALVTIDPLTGKVTIGSVKGAYGTQMFTIAADDGQPSNNLAADSFRLTINGVTDLPAISLSGDVVADEDFVTTEVVTVLAAATSPNFFPVEVRNNEYVPKDLYIFQGDIVEWTCTEGFHNVNAETSVYAANPEGFSNAVDGPGWTLTHQFTIPGIYHYQCDPHVSMGMTGTVTVLANRPPIRHHVEVSNMKFSPKDLVVLQGDTVIWTNVQGWHNVNFDTLLYPENPAGFGNDVAGPGWTFRWVFDVAGLYRYQCDPHVYMDMVGTVRVVERSGSLAADTTLPVVYRLLPSASSIANIRIDSATGSVLITSKPDKHGTERFEVIADYGVGIRTAAFRLTVLPKDDAPKPFSLLHPLNNIRLHEPYDNVLLRWQASQEVDGETVTYALNIHGVHDHFFRANISDTQFNVNALAYLRNDSIYEWWITASDGISEAECSRHFYFKSPLATGISMNEAEAALAVIDYPNPFREMITLQYRLHEAAHVRIETYGLLGDFIRVIADESQQPGWHQVRWDGTGGSGQPLAPGMYFYRVAVKSTSGTRREVMGSMIKTE